MEISWHGMAFMYFTPTFVYLRASPTVLSKILLRHNDWSRWFAINSSHVYAVPVFIGGAAIKKTANLDI